ncbi:unnamed protein product [Cyprideis torosa]|uniref:Uncharacterized protein n=1 Tax=Cyprideis torosa TaxID=163714 RepID=A0A7R8WJ18_9CRUS|nr:unnamed protein product [Cyprideis torosa]CAG0901441.1 unnamed protein product [Cyprideis torosa]
MKATESSSERNIKLEILPERMHFDLLRVQNISHEIGKARHWTNGTAIEERETTAAATEKNPKAVTSWLAPYGRDPRQLTSAD